MSTATHGPKSFLRSTALRTAENVAEELTPHCLKIDIAGSLRRQRPFVGDIDIVLLPRDAAAHQAILDRVGQKTKRIKNGPQYAVFEMTTGLQLDLWFAHAGKPEKRDLLGVVEQRPLPSNYGMLLLSRTGSITHNVSLCTLAKQKGLHLDPHAGITCAGLVVASETEEDIFTCLGLPFIAPERRER